MKWNIILLVLTIQTVQVFVNGGVMNKNDGFQCVVCNSSLPEQKNCTQTFNLLSFSQDCPNDDTNTCFVQIDHRNNDTQRGCGYPTEELNEVCSGYLCNTNIFPANRLSCNQCHPWQNYCPSNITYPYNISRICDKHVEFDQCYSAKTFYGENQLGCVSDSTYPNGCIYNNTCELCYGDNCNDQLFNQTLSNIQCYVCNSSRDYNCENGTDLYYYSQNCSSQYKECFVDLSTSKITTRGCGDGSYITLKKEICYKNNCNTHKLYDENDKPKPPPPTNNGSCVTNIFNIETMHVNSINLYGNGRN